VFEVFVLLRTSLESFYKLVCVSFHGGGCEGWHKLRILDWTVLAAENDLSMYRPAGTIWHKSCPDLG